MDKLEFTVTKEDWDEATGRISRGQRPICRNCVLAVALKRVTGKEFTVGMCRSVNGTFKRCAGRGTNMCFVYWLCDKAHDILNTFDKRSSFPGPTPVVLTRL